MAGESVQGAKIAGAFLNDKKTAIEELKKLELLEESEDQVGVCCLERLEEFNIKNSSGAQLELDLVRFVLAAAPELKRLSIKPKRDLSSGTMLRFLADVTLCKRISMEAEVEYALTNIDEGLNTLDLDHQ
ncbi:hypothetical protein LINPERHAP2_LOCUS38042 [Linum perenne]